ncbi:MAG: TIGR00269 family protein [Promethearchaeota archaeon]
MPAQETILCSRCKKNPAIVVRNLSGEVTCKRCFMGEIEKRVRRIMSRYKMMNKEDKIAFAISGGKDSITMLKIVMNIHGNLIAQQSRRGHAPVAITIDEGIKGYRQESLDISRRACAEAGLEHVVFSFEKEFGLSLDALVSKASDPGKLPEFLEKKPRGQLKNAGKLILKPCSICGVLRRRVLEDVARRLGATKLLLGHNLNDEIETFLMNVFRGDVTRIRRAASSLLDDNPEFVRKIKPLRDVLQQDIVLYLHHAGGQFQSAPCPYSVGDVVFRGEIQGILSQMEDSHPGSSYNVMKFLDETFPDVKQPPVESSISRCSNCGRPKSKHMGKCMACYYVERLCGKNYVEVMDSFISRHA